MLGDLVEKLENFIQEYFFSNSVYTLFKEIVLPHWKFSAQHRKLLG